MELLASIMLWIGGLIIAGGWCSWISYLLTKKTSSLIPFLGSLFFVLGVYLHPNVDFWNPFKPWVLLAFVVDLGSLPLVCLQWVKRNEE